MFQISFENLPNAVFSLQGEIQEIKKMLSALLMPQPVEQDQFLNLQDAANYLELAPPTIYALVSRKQIPVYKRGNRLYFSKQELITWVKEGRKKTSAETEMDAEVHLAQLRRGGKK